MMNKGDAFFVGCLIVSAALIGVMAGSVFLGKTEKVVEWKETTVNNLYILPATAPEEEARINEMVLDGAYPYDGRSDTKAWGRLDEFRVKQTCFGRMYLHYVEHKSFDGFECEDD